MAINYGETPVMYALVLCAYLAAGFLNGAVAYKLGERFTHAVGVSFAIMVWALLTFSALRQLGAA